MKNHVGMLWLVMGCILTIIAMTVPGPLTLTTAMFSIKGIIGILGGTIILYLPKQEPEKPKPEKPKPEKKD